MKESKICQSLVKLYQFIYRRIGEVSEEKLKAASVEIYPEGNPDDLVVEEVEKALSSGKMGGFVEIFKEFVTYRRGKGAPRPYDISNDLDAEPGYQEVKAKFKLARKGLMNDANTTAFYAGLAALYAEKEDIIFPSDKEKELRQE